MGGAATSRRTRLVYVTNTAAPMRMPHSPRPLLSLTPRCTLTLTLTLALTLSPSVPTFFFCCKVSRSQLLQHAEQVMSMYTPSKAVLEFRFAGEKGLGAGVTASFYSAVAAELQRRSVNTKARFLRPSVSFLFLFVCRLLLPSRFVVLFISALQQYLVSSC